MFTAHIVTVEDHTPINYHVKCGGGPVWKQVWHVWNFTRLMVDGSECLQHLSIYTVYMVIFDTCVVKSRCRYSRFLYGLIRHKPHCCFWISCVTLQFVVMYLSITWFWEASQIFCLMFVPAFPIPSPGMNFSGCFCALWSLGVASPKCNHGNRKTQ